MIKNNYFLSFCLVLGISLILSTLLLAQVVQEEELKDDSNITLAFEQAVKTFASIYQSSSIPEFEKIINTLQQKRTVGELSTELNDILLKSYEYRARAFYNSGQLEMAANDFAEITKLDQKYSLDESSVSPKIIELFEKVKRDNIGYIVVKSEPPGANVRLNNKLIGVTNLFQTPYLKGVYQLEVELPGYEVKSQIVEILPQETKEISVELVRNSAAAYIVTQPTGVEIVIDGKSYGITSGPPDPAYKEKAEEYGLDFSKLSDELKVSNIPLGTHMVEFRKKCYESVRKNVNFINPEDYSLKPVALEPSLAHLTISSNPSGADIYLNDRLMGRTPAELKDLCSGKYHLVLKHTHGQFIKDLELNKDQSIQLNCTLRPTLLFLGVLPEKDLDNSLITEIEEEVKALLMKVDSLNITSIPIMKSNSMLSRKGLNVLHLTKKADTHGQKTSDKRLLEAINYIADQSEAELLVAAYMPKEEARTLFISVICPGNPSIENFEVNLVSGLDTADFISKINASFSLQKTWLGAKTIDTLLYSGIPTISISPSSPADLAGIKPGDIIETIDKVKINQTLDLLNYLKNKKANQKVILGIRNETGLLEKEVTLGISPVEVPLNSINLSYNKLMADLQHIASSSSNIELKMLANYNLGLIYMHFHRWTDSIKQFKKAMLKSQNGIGIGTVLYRMAQCYQNLGYNKEAIAYYKEAISNKNNTILENDGPLVSPLAERSLAKIER